MATRAAKAAKPGAVKPASKPKAVEPVAPMPPPCQPVSVEEIRLRAYQRWEAAGRPPGDGVRFWFEAEQELLQGK
jgi:hypothetical protein